MLKLEIMNEITNFVLLYHTMLFSEYVGSIETRYIIGWSFIFVTSANMLVHFLLLVIDTGSEIREKCRSSKCYRNCVKRGCCGCKPELEKPIVIEEKPSKKKELSVIVEDVFESNFSSEMRDENSSFESDWKSSVHGNSQRAGGYNFGEIKWTDLGKKYMHKDGKVSRIAEGETVSEGRFDDGVGDDFVSVQPE